MIGQEEFCDFKQHFSGREDLCLNGVCSQRRGKRCEDMDRKNSRDRWER